jgi:acetoacetyl-CoA reductase
MPKVALVTGGTRGIGAAISVALKQAGYRVAANYAGNDTAAAEFAERTGIPVYKWSVADYEACKQGVAKVVAELGTVSVLVNNAGITRDAMFHRMTPENWKEVIDTNLTGLFNMTHQVWNAMRSAKFGRVISISSINGQKGQMGQANYSSAKANAVCPGYIATEMVMAVSEKMRDQIVAQIPVGRLGEPDEIARCVVFLASDEAGFINGSTLSANGGQYLA